MTDGVETILGTMFLGDDPDFEGVCRGVDGTTVALNTHLDGGTRHRASCAGWQPSSPTVVPDTGLLVVGADTDINDGGANSGFAGDGGPPPCALNIPAPSPLSVTGDFVSWISGHRVRIAADFSLIETIAKATRPRWLATADPPSMGASSSGSRPSCSRALGCHRVRRGSRHALHQTHECVIRTTIWEHHRHAPGTGNQALPDGACDPDALCFPRDVELGRRAIADTNNHVVRTVNLETGDDVIVGRFASGPTEDNTRAQTALNTPHGIDIAPDGTLLIADTYNHQILKVVP